jgi:hypothetical protein
MHTSLQVGGWGESQFRRGAYTVVLFICTYFVIETDYMAIGKTLLSDFLHKNVRSCHTFGYMIYNIYIPILYSIINFFCLETETGKK